MNAPGTRFRVSNSDQSRARPRGDSPHGYTVVYDGQCRFCTRIVRRLEKWDRNRVLETLPSQHADVRGRFPWIPSSAYAESLQLVRGDGRTWQGSAAIEELLRVLPRGRLISWLFRIPLIRPLAERAYRWVARNRSRLGCAVHCRPGRDSFPTGPPT